MTKELANFVTQLFRVILSVWMRSDLTNYRISKCRAGKKNLKLFSSNKKNLAFGIQEVSYQHQVSFYIALGIGTYVHHTKYQGRVPFLQEYNFFQRVKISGWVLPFDQDIKEYQLQGGTLWKNRQLHPNILCLTFVHILFSVYLWKPILRSTWVFQCTVV